jgi:hypothetical protein
LQTWRHFTLNIFHIHFLRIRRLSSKTKYFKSLSQEFSSKKVIV